MPAIKILQKGDTIMANNPFYSNPANNPYAWNNNYAPGTSYAPQTGNYMAEKFGKKWSLRSFH